MRRHEEARWHLERALALHDGYPEADIKLGTVLIRIDQLNEAHESYLKALALQPDSANAHSGLSHMFGGLDEPAAAMTHHRRSIVLSPFSAWLQSNLIYTLHFDPAAIAPTLRVECERWEQHHAVSLGAHSVRIPIAPTSHGG